MCLLLYTTYNTACKMLLYIDRWKNLRSRYNNTMTLLRKSRNASIAAEHRNNFGCRRKSGGMEIGRSKRPKHSNSWTHKFVCMAYTDQDKCCTSAEKNELMLAGLGEKKITLPDIDCSPEDFRKCITTAFPKLDASGGFEYLKCAPSTRKLEVIPFPVSNSPHRLKAWMGTANIYIRPIQRNLDLHKCEEFDDEVRP